MQVQEVLTKLQNAGVTLNTDGDNLKVKSKFGPLDADLRSLVVQYKAQILEVLQRAAGLAQNYPQIVPVGDESIQPVSLAQMRLWLLNEMGADNGTYQINLTLELNGTLNIQALQASLNWIWQRHSVLRATFTQQGDEVIQSVLHAELVLQQHDAAANNWADLLRALQLEPMNLSTGPLFCTHLLHRSPQQHILLISIHHIVFDGWSNTVLFRELQLAYDSFCHGKIPALPPLQISYADYAAWQKIYITPETFEEQRQYWLEALQDAPALLTLPCDYPRPALQSYAGKLMNLQLPDSLIAQLSEMSKSLGMTLYVPMFAAFVVLLSRYAGQKDIVVGAPFAGRNNPQLRDLIGFFVNTLALRIQLDPQTSWSDLLQQVHNRHVKAQIYQDVSLEGLLPQLGIKRDASFSPLYQVMFDLELGGGAGSQPVSDGELSFAYLSSEVVTAKFDITLNVNHSEHKTVAAFEYNCDLFRSETIAQFAGHYLETLQHLAADLNGQIFNHHWRGSDGAFLSGPLIDFAGQDVLVAFESVAQMVPAQLAIVQGGFSCSYQNLYQRVAQLATALYDADVQVGDRIAICLPRCPDTVAAMLAVLKVGAVYVPVDISYPAERVAYMLADARPRLMLGDSRVTQCNEAVPVLWLDNLPWQAGFSALTRVVAVNAPAYIMYTSGSTGQPKGVVITRKGLNNHSFAMVQEFGLTAVDRVLQFSSVSFDIVVEELFPALSQGSCVVLYEGEIALEVFEDYLAEHQVSVVNLPTAYWHLWVSHAVSSRKSLPGLRHVTVGGEAANEMLLGQWRDVYPQVQWLNSYGPTEITVVASCWRAPEELIAGAIPLGSPLPNRQLMLLDNDLNPVPTGVAGKLFISGVGLAQGYWQNAEATAQSFVANPFGEPGERMYDTGDLVKRDEQGRLLYMGRADNQVKIRGYRVEPDEVCAVLRSCPQVKDGVVVVVDTAGGKQLVAYVVAMATPTEIKRWLQEALPDYLVPAFVVKVDDLPLNANGKIDRKRLPAIGSQVAEDYVAAANATEHALVEIWAELLQQDAATLSVTHSFFALGGHSLLAVRLVSRMSARLGTQISLARFYKTPTIREIAIMLSDVSDSASVVLLNRGKAKVNIFAIHPVGGDVICYSELAEELSDFSVYGVRRPDLSLPVATRHYSIEEMASYYLAEIRKVQNEGPYHFIAWSMGGDIVNEVCNIIHREGGVISSVILIDYIPSHDSNNAEVLNWIASNGFDVSGDVGSLVSGLLADSALSNAVESYFNLDYVPAGFLKERYKTLSLYNLFASIQYKSIPTYCSGKYIRFSASATIDRVDYKNALDKYEELINSDKCRFVLDADHYSIIKGDALREIVKNIKFNII